MKYVLRVWTEFICLKVEPSCGRLWTRYWHVRLHKEGWYRSVACLSAPEEGRQFHGCSFSVAEKVKIKLKPPYERLSYQYFKLFEWQCVRSTDPSLRRHFATLSQNVIPLCWELVSEWRRFNVHIEYFSSFRSFWFVLINSVFEAFIKRLSE
jgi:hypothetical protein